MKEITAYFLNKNILFKNIENIETKKINSRKKIDIHIATSVKREYYSIFTINSKSRFLKRNAQELIELNEKLANYANHNFKKRVLLISSPLCSKAKEFLEQNDWSVKIDFM